LRERNAYTFDGVALESTCMQISTRGFGIDGAARRSLLNELGVRGQREGFVIGRF